MNRFTKIAAISTLVGGGIYAGYRYFSGLVKVSEELQSVSSMMVHKLGLDGLTIRVDVKLKNPTATSLKLKYPFVKLIYQDAVIGSSQAIDKDIQINGFGEANINQIMINIPVAGIFSLGAGMVKSLMANEPIKVVSKVLTTIDLGWKKLPYEKTQEQTLNA